MLLGARGLRNFWDLMLYTLNCGKSEMGGACQNQTENHYCGYRIIIFNLCLNLIMFSFNPLYLCFFCLWNIKEEHLKNNYVCSLVHMTFYEYIHLIVCCMTNNKMAYIEYLLQSNNNTESEMCLHVNGSCHGFSDQSHAH